MASQVFVVIGIPPPRPIHWPSINLRLYLCKIMTDSLCLSFRYLRQDTRLEVNKSHNHSHSATCHHLCSVSNMLMFSDLECITHTGPSTGWLVLDGKLRRSSYFGSPAAAKCAAPVSQYPCTQCQKISRIKILFRMQFLKHCQENRVSGDWRDSNIALELHDLTVSK